MRDLTAARKLSLAFVGVDTHKILRDAGAAVVIDDFRNFDSFLNSLTQSLASSPLKVQRRPKSQGSDLKNLVFPPLAGISAAVFGLRKASGDGSSDPWGSKRGGAARAFGIFG
jgi:hypothetical protein